MKNKFICGDNLFGEKARHKTMPQALNSQNRGNYETILKGKKGGGNGNFRNCLLGVLGFLVSLVALIIALVRKKRKKRWLLSFVAFLVLIFVGASLLPTTGKPVQKKKLGSGLHI